LGFVSSNDDYFIESSDTSDSDGTFVNDQISDCESLNDCDFDEDFNNLPKDFKMEGEDYNKKLLNDSLAFQKALSDGIPIHACSVCNSLKTNYEIFKIKYEWIMLVNETVLFPINVFI
jgi:hypothetical protein